MQILPYNIFKKVVGVAVLSTIPLVATPKSYPMTTDAFVLTSVIPPQGDKSVSVLKKAPSPYIRILGSKRTASIVVDLKNNILYKYDQNGVAQCAYSVATGKTATPTHKGVRIVSHIEKYPYKSAGRNTKRRRAPGAFGPKIIMLKMINPQTGETWDNGEYIHGNNNSNSIGKKVSHGCVRMHNDDIKFISSQVKSGDIVIFK